jgi:hypothetical protein
MAQNPQVPTKRGGFRAAVSDFVSRLGILGEFMQFLWARKLWWLIPMFVVLGIFVLLIILGVAMGNNPFLYPIF